MEICDIPLQDDVTFSFISIGDIREDDEYSGFRVSLSANFPPMAVPLKLDITTGDKITPKEISYEFKLLLLRLFLLKNMRPLFEEIYL